MRAEPEAVGGSAEDQSLAELAEGLPEHACDLLALAEQAIIVTYPLPQDAKSFLGGRGVDDALAFLLDGADDALVRAPNHLLLRRRLLLALLFLVVVLLATG